MQDSPGSLPPWLMNWMLGVESRLGNIQGQLRHLGAKTTERAEGRPTWQPRDYMAAGAGIAMVLAVIADKIGWTTLAASLVKLYGSE